MRERKRRPGERKGKVERKRRRWEKGYEEGLGGRETRQIWKDEKRGSKKEEKGGRESRTG